ncbi:hypothetical protein HPB47_024661 [Ixodes persulcatus]|uniref:Uncharacterized protein n=1 Tax=Ixodes persulcatus TaxID=34615 RepID=A0AC60Q5Y9_IXOPE|nr:hypothetical protein HPB47_024661 [Ixodes persulcatus]
MFAVNAMTHNYVVAQELSKQTEFMKVPIQRQFVSELTMEVLSTNETSDFDACEEGHTRLASVLEAKLDVGWVLGHRAGDMVESRAENCSKHMAGHSAGNRVGLPNWAHDWIKGWSTGLGT